MFWLHNINTNTYALLVRESNILYHLLSQDSFTALISTSVIPEGIQTTIRRLSKHSLMQVCFYKHTDHFSEASKSAITHQRSYCLNVFMCFTLHHIGSLPTAMIFPEILSRATIEGLSLLYHYV
jgi:hypothetical protein